MEQELIDLYKDYDTGLINRREFMAKMAIIAGSITAASSLLMLLENDYALADIISKDDPRIQSEYINYPGASGDIRADLVTPKGDGKVPGVVVIHEIWGLNSHIEDVARRLGVEGFLALAPDALTPVGGTPEDPMKAFPLVRELDNEANVKNYVAAVKFLQSHPKSNGNVGITGFCWGGGVANQVAVNSPDLKAAVPFYGSQPKAEDVHKIKASLLLHYAENDERINRGIPAFEEALKKASVDYRIHMYEGTQHAFYNDTNAERYHKEAAQLAWKRTIEFFKEKLKT
ncbi:MAG: dienelactone hydrolase family protein [Deltaproteobacteria bacterium]|nr:dienelactone hydrolase family protein [Deltaproteobacteria bacterium]